MTIEEIRHEIDQLDCQILDLLNQRARLSLQIGREKKTQRLPIEMPGREAQIVSRLQELNGGPLPQAAIPRIYEVIIQTSRWIQEQSDLV